MEVIRAHHWREHTHTHDSECSREGKRNLISSAPPPSSLERRVVTPPDEEEIEKLARDRLGLVMPNETIFVFTEENSTKKEG